MKPNVPSPDHDISDLRMPTTEKLRLIDLPPLKLVATEGDHATLEVPFVGSGKWAGRWPDDVGDLPRYFRFVLGPGGPAVRAVSYHVHDEGVSAQVLLGEPGTFVAFVH